MTLPLLPRQRTSIEMLVDTLRQSRVCERPLQCISRHGDTPWLSYDAAASLIDSGFKMYHEREHGFVCLRKPALQ
jgi:hypothetical protein